MTNELSINPSLDPLAGADQRPLPALRCSGLTQRFGETVAVDALDWRCPR